MSLEVVWSPAGEAALLRLPSWRLAARVARGVEDLARNGEGELRRVGASRTEFALYVGSCCVRLSFDQASRRIDIWHVFELR
ncbi:MAG: hypothetical protein QM820_27420 [Minicystis sp.]